MCSRSLDLSVCPSMLLAFPRLHSRSYPCHFTLITRTAHVLAPATLAALPPTRAIETRSLPTSLAATHRGFAFYVASPKSSIPDRAVFYVAHPHPLHCISLTPARLDRYPRGLTGHVAHPSRSIGEFRLLELIKTDSA